MASRSESCCHAAKFHEVAPLHSDVFRSSALMRNRLMQRKDVTSRGGECSRSRIFVPFQRVE